MLRPLTVIAMLVLTTACAHKNIFGYTHKQHGEGNIDNPVFKRDQDDCAKSVYANGVMVEGVRVTDPKAIETLQFEYNQILVQNMREMIKSTAGSGAYAGAAAATAVTTGNTSGINSSPKQRSMPETPEKFRDLDRLRGLVGECLAAKGWKHN